MNELISEQDRQKINHLQNGLLVANMKIKELEAEVEYHKKDATAFCKQSQEKNDVITELEKKLAELEKYEGLYLTTLDRAHESEKKLAESEKQLTREVFKYSKMASLEEENKNLGKRIKEMAEVYQSGLDSFTGIESELDKEKEKLKVAVEIIKQAHHQLNNGETSKAQSIFFFFI